MHGIVRGPAFVQKKYPKLMFATEGLYEIDGNRCFVTNGAYSVDKYYRLEKGASWFPDEELSDAEMAETLAKAEQARTVDYVFSHTCPAKYMPTFMFIDGMDKSKISHRMEEFYDQLEETLDYKRWWCGHFHTDWSIDKMRFMYSITQRDLDDALMDITLQTLVLSGVFFAVAAAAALPLSRALGFGVGTQGGAVQAVFVTSNAGFMGFPVVQMLFGADVFYCMVLFNIVMNFYLYSVCIIQLGGGSPLQVFRLSGLKKMLNPCMISAAASVILLFAGIHLPRLVCGLIGPVGDASIPMAMLLIGIQISDGRFLRQLKEKKILL